MDATTSANPSTSNTNSNTPAAATQLCPNTTHPLPPLVLPPLGPAVVPSKGCTYQYTVHGYTIRAVAGSAAAT